MKYLMFLFLISFSVVVSAREYIKLDDSEWSKSEEVDDFTGEKKLFYIMEANEKGARINETPVLGVRCLNKKTELFFYMGNMDFFSFGGGYEKIGIKIDNEKPYYEKLSKSSDSRGVFFNKPINFLNKIKNNSKIIIRYEPYGENEKNATFEIKGINQIVDEMSETCKWPKK